MKKVSVKSAGKLHRPVLYGCLPMDPPRPLCGMIGMEENPSWSALDPNCEACERMFAYKNRIKPINPQTEMGI